MVTRDNTPQVLSTIRNNFPAGTSFSILAVTPDGKISVHASDILKPYADKWYDEEVRKDARAAVETLPARKRGHISLSLPVSKTSSKKATAATAATASTVSQTISPPPEEDEVPSVAGIVEEEASPSSLSTTRLKKKRRLSTSLQEPSIDTTTAAVIKQQRRRKSNPGIKSIPNPPRIKEEDEIPEGLQIESDWATIDMMQDGEGDPNEGNEEEEDSDEEELQLEALRIGDENAVNKYIYNKFLQIQQLDCKTIAKCWIKVIEPKKQAHSPYNGGDSTKPWWWPEGAPHKEPDHLLKEDRLDVLLNIVRNGIVPICQLRASTDDAPLRSAKKEILAEMYDVVDLELRLKEGNLDRDHIRFVKPFIKGNKRRKKRVPKTNQPKAPLPPKDKLRRGSMKIETGDPMLSSILESESNLANYFKQEEDQETADGILVQRPDLIADNPVYPGHGISQAHDPQASYPRRQSTGVIGAANPSVTPIIGSQHRSNSVPYVQHTSGRFGRDRLGTANPPAAQFVSQSVQSSPGMADVPTQVFELTPSPTSLSPYVTNQSPAVNIMAATHADPPPSLYHYTGTVFDQITYAIPSPSDITMGDLYPSPPITTNIFQPTYSTSPDFYSGFALEDTQSIQNYPPPPPQFFPEHGVRDIAMTDGTNSYGP